VPRTRHLAVLHLILLVAFIYLPATARAVQSVTLEATLTPERLGHGTTIVFGFQIAGGGETPPPLTALDLRYPSDLGIALSGLGLDTCSPETLQTAGPQACPADSLMGSGSAFAEIPFGPQLVQESTAVTIVRAPSENGHLALLIHAAGASPVIANIVFPALLLPSTAPFGERLRADVPLIPSLPGAPDVAMVSMHATLGPKGIVYNERVGRTTVSYRPNGILLPDRCPHGGFPFAATFAFLDGTHAIARTNVPCPAQRRRG
jgi:hypothetical protein